ASDGFDSQRGVMFSTYAVPVIMGEIKRLFRDGGSVKVSRSIKELSVKIVKAKSSLSIKLGREPQISELATELEVTAEQITEAVAASQAVCSLTDNSDDSKNQIDVPTEGHEFSLTNKIAIEQALKQLVGKDRDLIFLRFVLNKTQSETATALSMTQVQISRREKKILEILRKYLC
ncbi:MAG: sigma-70 family RNA polymerase sigma factor, partial [Oscillospiraceae bacterium]